MKIPPENIRGATTMKPMPIISVCILLLFPFSIFSNDELRKIEGVGIYTSDDIYQDESGKLYSNTVYITLTDHVTIDKWKSREITRTDINDDYKTLKDVISILESDHGFISFGTDNASLLWLRDLPPDKLPHVINLSWCSFYSTGTHDETYFVPFFDFLNGIAGGVETITHYNPEV
jgi:hypothetical protein